MVAFLSVLGLMSALAGAPNAAAPDAAPLTASAQAAPSPTPTPTPRYVVAMDSGRQAAAVDLASRAQDGGALSFSVSVLRRTPVRIAGARVYWADGRLSVDCAAHRLAMTLTEGWPLGRAQRLDLPASTARAWARDLATPKARAFARIACRGDGAEGLRSVPDLVRFEQDYGPASAAGRAPAPRTGVIALPKAPYYAVATDEDGALIVQTDGIQRTGDVVSVTVYALTTRPLPEDREAYWIRSSAEVDCAGHRMRDETLALLDLDLKAKRVRASPTFGDWYPNPPGAAGARIEAAVCLASPGDGAIAVQSLKDFQGAVFNAAKPRK